MKIAIDGYCCHRHFGEIYPNSETEPALKLNFWQCLEQAIDFDIEGISIESFMFSHPQAQDVERLKTILKQHQIELVSAWKYPCDFESGKNLNALDVFKKHVSSAQKLGAKVMRICAGGRPQDSWQTHKSILLALIEQATDFAIQYNIIMANEIVDLVKCINHEHFGICLDTAHNLRMLEDP
ncbi:sugar phosphate isomerase/epimerase [Acinetobacter sp. Marseille-Q1618]|uniref:sugar phosphate isomerase/epimerase family protein n=1 Tax=Acinetobacter sp. Marseille-Q1618 TaxID=2697502 RepID=UPI0020C3DFA9|nr:TIM barrel protein [Acinetobacter sp. Marseille-Q1618]